MFQKHGTPKNFRHKIWKWLGVKECRLGTQVGTAWKLLYPYLDFLTPNRFGVMAANVLKLSILFAKVLGIGKQLRF